MPTLSIPGLRPRLARSRSLTWAGAAYTPAFVFLYACMHVLVVAGERFTFPRLEDDSFYYLVIAEQIAATGRSEFTPGVLTNGYQPLWMLALLGMGSLFGFVTATLKALDFVTIFSGFVLFYWLFRVRTLLASFFYTAALWYLLETFAINGMESSLLFPGFVLCVGAFLSDHPFIARWRAWLGVLGVLICSGARLDAGLFLAPVLAVAPISRRARVLSFAGLAAVGLVYIAFNQVVFGSALPVSGMVKSLGGFQLNHAYLAQFVRELDAGQFWHLRSCVTPYFLGFVVWLAASLLLRRRDTAEAQLLRRMIYAGLCGLVLFGAKLVLLSSWGVWPWYRFPGLYFALLAIWLVETAVPATRLTRLAQGVLGACLAVTQFQSVLADRSSGFAGLSRRFMADKSAELAGQTVAMGDRAGSFAFDYSGGVFQLEGLVNGPDYIDVLRRGGDLRPYLCANQIPLVISYEVPLGDYQQHRVAALHSDLTTFRGPSVLVERSEEIATYEDPTQFRDRESRIYAWKLRCD